MHLCGHSSIEFLRSCDARAQDSFSLFKSTQCFQNMFFYQFMHSSKSISGVRENFHSIHPSGAYTFFFNNWCFDRWIFFSKKSWKLFLFDSMLAFQLKDIFFVLVCLFFFHEVFCYLSMCIFLWDIFAIYMHIQGILLPKYTYIYIYIFCEVFLLHTCIFKVSFYLNTHTHTHTHTGQPIRLIRLFNKSKPDLFNLIGF